MRPDAQPAPTAMDAILIVILVAWTLGLMLAPLYPGAGSPAGEGAVRAAEPVLMADAARTISIDQRTRMITVHWDHLPRQWQWQHVAFGDLACIAYYPGMATGPTGDPDRARVELVTTDGRAIPVPGSEPPHSPEAGGRLAASLAADTDSHTVAITSGRSVETVCELNTPVSRPWLAASPR